MTDLLEKDHKINFPEMRPPVMSVSGYSPIKGTRGKRAFGVVKKPDHNGYKVTKRDVAKNYTNDGLIVHPNRWDARHQVCPSNFNNRNTSYFK